MTNKQILFLWLFFLLPVCVLQAEALPFLKGKQIAFYTEENSSFSKKEKLLQEIWFFKSDGTYKCCSAKACQWGDCSYRLLEDRKQAQLILTSSTAQGNEVFHIELYFDTRTIGRWRCLQGAEMHLLQVQEGLFEVIDSKKAKDLMPHL